MGKTYDNPAPLSLPSSWIMLSINIFGCHYCSVDMRQGLSNRITGGNPDTLDPREEEILQEKVILLIILPIQIC